MVFIPKHARDQMEKRGIDEAEVIETIQNGEIAFEEQNGRMGTKKYSRLPLGMKSLIVIWFVNENNEEEVITAYWRRNKKWEK